jgi:hypothetical protein
MNTSRLIKKTLDGQIEKIVTIIDHFRGDRCLTFRPLVRILGRNYTLCLHREDNFIEVMFTDERDNFLLDSFGLNMSGVLTIIPEDSTEEIQKKIEAEVQKLVVEFVLK